MPGLTLKSAVVGVLGIASHALEDYGHLGDISDADRAIATDLVGIGLADPETTVPTIGEVSLVTVVEGTFYAADAGSAFLSQIQTDINR